MTAHSVIGASGMHRWAVCPGSVPLATISPPGVESAAAYEGTLAHAVAEHRLQTGAWPAQVDIRGKMEPVEQEMVEHLKVYVDYVESR